jgi:hypothetical protein
MRIGWDEMDGKVRVPIQGYVRMEESSTHDTKTEQKKTSDTRCFESLAPRVGRPRDPGRPLLHFSGQDHERVFALRALFGAKTMQGQAS